MQAKNVVGDLIKDLTRFKEADPRSLIGPPLSAKDLQVLDDFLILLDAGQKFILPDEGLVLGEVPTHFTRDQLPTMKLPFPICVFVFDSPHKHSLKATDLARVTGKYRAHNDEPVLTGRTALLAIQQEDCIRVYGFVERENRLVKWTPDAFYLEIDLTSIDEEIHEVDTPSNLFFRLYGQTETFSNMLKTATAEQKDMIQIQSIATALPVIQVLAALQCSNVEVENIDGTGAPYAVNEKRVRKGKAPLYTYKQLVISTSHAHAVIDGESAGKTHASPRQHLRRGHIRRLQSGKRIWINAMVVGRTTTGIVDKEYKLKGAA